MLGFDGVSRCLARDLAYPPGGLERILRILLQFSTVPAECILEAGSSPALPWYRFFVNN